MRNFHHNNSYKLVLIIIFEMKLKISSDLALLASQAAIVLDNSCSDKRVDYEPVYKLAEVLQESVVKDNFGSPKLVEPGAFSIFYQTLVKDMGERISTPDELPLYVLLVSKDLKSVSDLSRERVEDLRDFCANFSLGLCSALSHDYSHRLVA